MSIDAQYAEKNSKCTDCDEDIDLPRNAMIIPGLSAALITENERRNPSNETDT